MKKTLLVIPCMWFLLLGESALAQDQSECQDRLNCKSSWLDATDEQRAQIFAFAEQYKAFIHNARTELSFATEARVMAKSFYAFRE